MLFKKSSEENMVDDEDVKKGFLDSTSSSSSSLKKSSSIMVATNNNFNENDKGKDSVKHSFYWTVLEFLLCFCSLQVSYVLWGMMQELIMNTKFNPTTFVPSGRFPSATFCVFSNRFLAIIISAAICLIKHRTLTSAAPFLSFTPCAVSNTLSSWAQYQALSYVGFSLQTIFKSTKVLPVMLMGYILKKTKYNFIDYFEAIGITFGVLIFSFSNDNQATTISAEVIGILLLSLYVLSDSFTAQWQSTIYRDYGKIDQFQMMFGVNLNAIIITSFALIISGELTIIIDFLNKNPIALWYNVVTAITSTTGQCAIFYTIKRFGPITFTIIMTTRQMVSIVVSNYMFNHKMSIQSYIGSTIVFIVIGYCLHIKMKEKKDDDNNDNRDTKIAMMKTKTSESSNHHHSNINRSSSADIELTEDNRDIEDNDQSPLLLRDDEENQRRDVK